jgi:hypothetical protein
VRGDDNDDDDNEVNMDMKGSGCNEFEVNIL